MSEIHPDDQRLLDPRWLANHAHGPLPFFRGEYSVPGVTWVKDDGPYEPGRIGRRVVSGVPLSWLPKALGDQVRSILNGRVTPAEVVPSQEPRR